MLINKSRLPVTDILLIGCLPGFLKKLVYRIKGYKIGKKVHIGFGSVISGKDVSVGDYSKIGFFTIIRGDNITIGTHVSIGSTTFLDTPILEIGDESKINEQVFIGGLQLNDSKFILGKNCQIMQLSYINPATSITIGDDSVVGGHSLIFGHNSWLNLFEGYDVIFKPIEIGKSVALSWRVFLLPGTVIGDGSVIAPETLVNRIIPPKSLAAGNPARIISKSPEFPKDVSEEQKVDILRNIIDEMINYFNGSGLKCIKDEDYYDIVQEKEFWFFKKMKRFSMIVLYDSIPKIKLFPREKKLSVLVSLRAISKDIRNDLNSRGVMWLDLEKKERPLFWNDLGDEVALFLRRYGVRFIRVTN